MPLKRKHLIATRINWQSKSSNLQSLAKELRLGLDSFIFVDDNPIECAEVETYCPDVFTLELPENPETIPHFLKHIWAFDHVEMTEEDRKRTERYQQNLEREQFREASLSFADFLQELELKVRIAELRTEQLPRVSQLTRRTNQFNFTTIRRSEGEIQALCMTQGYECLVVDVSDRFGDYGLVGVVLFAAKADLLQVDSFLLSCRVLGRGVEHQMVSRLGEIARRRGLSEVHISFSPSERNQPALDFLEQIGSDFKAQSEEGLLFKLPAAVAASVHYAPAQETI